MKLYYAPKTRASRVRWVLEELGEPFELVRVNTAAGEHKRPEYLRIHPLGKLPALTDGDAVLFETGAICLYLGDRFPAGGLAPAVDSPDRAAYLQWILFAITELEPSVLAFHYDRGDVAAWRERADIVANALADREFMVGDRFTVADIMIGGALGWAKPVGLLDDYPVLADYGRRVGGRPAAKRSRAD